MLAHERHKKILELLESGDSMHVEEFQTILSVSEATVRNDLRRLQAQGLILRSHGGARRIDRPPAETSYEQREVVRHHQKQRIGIEAAKRIGPQETVFFDSGSTVIEAAKHAPRGFEFHVVTAALNTAYVAGKLPNVNVHVVGGMLRESLHELVGPKAVASIREVRAHKAFLGVSAVDLEFGLMENHVLSAEVKRAMASSAREIIVLADSSKMGKVGFAPLLALRDVNVLITDDGISEAFVDRVRDEGVEVVVT